MMCWHRWKEILVGNSWTDTVEVIYECDKCSRWKFIYEFMQERSDKLLFELTKGLL